MPSLDSGKSCFAHKTLICVAAVLIELDAEWPDFVKRAGRFVGGIFSFDLGTVSSPECSVSDQVAQAADGAHMIFLYKVGTQSVFLCSSHVLLLCKSSADSEHSARQFAATHVSFVAIVVVLLVIALIQYIQSKTADMRSFRHMMNTINAVLTLSMVSLTKSALSALDCTYKEVTKNGAYESTFRFSYPFFGDRTCSREFIIHECGYYPQDDDAWQKIISDTGCASDCEYGTYVETIGQLDAMPAVTCSGIVFESQAWVALGLVFLYNVVIPFKLFQTLRHARQELVKYENLPDGSNGTIIRARPSGNFVRRQPRYCFFFASIASIVVGTLVGNKGASANEGLLVTMLMLVVLMTTLFCWYARATTCNCFWPNRFKGDKAKPKKTWPVLQEAPKGWFRLIEDSNFLQTNGWFLLKYRPVRNEDLNLAVQSICMHVCARARVAPG